jgi:N-glycosylase/DNA lyase
MATRKTIGFNRGLTLCLLLVLLGATLLPAQHPSIFEQLSEGEKPIQVTISTDLESLINERRGEDAQAALLTFSTPDKREYQLEVEVSSRGKFRRRRCDFPPLRLDFSRRHLEEQGFDRSFRKLKLVTHCLEDARISQDNIVKEYLVYQLYRELTDFSFRARLARIDYLDTEQKLRRIRRYGIFLEEVDELAQRHGLEECKNCYGMVGPQLDADIENLMCVFQYMIGNTDWDINMVRNIKLLMPADSSRFIPTPYDFDFAGFVSPSYAVPDANYGLASLKQRVFLGRQAPWEDLARTLELFVAKKPEMLKLVRNARQLSAPARQECLEYLRSFYDEIEALLATQGVGYPDSFRAWSGRE